MWLYQGIQIVMSDSAVNASIEKSTALTLALTIYQYNSSLVVVGVSHLPVGRVSLT